ncbi:S-adenosyl-L-methionine-dependent methyltransferase [Tricladium varicosporioides]|nr:S-adenosyl-L-methionine-dependent methyltransferase [Hymenoscyphus varicosporioides]
MAAISSTTTPRTFHDANAHKYDRMASGCTASIAEQFLKNLPVPITEESIVLDNACGTGLVSQFLKDACPSVHITGADLASGMIEAYEGRAKRNSWTRTSTSQLDCRDLHTLEDNTFTHVITNFGFAPDASDPGGPSKAAREMYRVLKPGGLCIVTTWAERNFDPAIINTSLTIRPDKPHGYWESIPNYHKGHFLLRELEDAGFGYNCSISAVKGGLSAISFDQLVDNMLEFKDMFWKDYSEDEWGRVRGVLGTELRKLEAFKEKGDGSVGVEMIAWVGMGWKV